MPKIIFADAHLVVVDKPTGMLSVPGRGEDKQDCLATRVQQLFPDALIVHRLDMATSGLLVLARSKFMQRELNFLFAQRQVEKTYQARLAGRPAADQGCIDLPLICDWPLRPRQKVCFEHGKASQTGFQVLDHDPVADSCLVALHPYTGRSHQLRVHMQALGHPILGDDLYAPPVVQAAAPRLLLHAVFLAFPHPQGGARVSFTSVAPF